MSRFIPNHNRYAKNHKKHITHFLIMGDSLSDRSTFKSRKLFGFIPLGPLSGLNYSPRGRFTNGYTWSDDVSNWFVQDAIIRDFINNRKLSFTDLADAVVTNEYHVKSIIHSWYNLDNDKEVNVKSTPVVRSFAEGGATSFDYSWHLSTSIKRFFTRLIVSTLSAKRAELIKDDAQRHTTLKEKRHTLVAEWTGANDLITVNKEPSHLEADRAVAERIKNVRKLIREGYHNFALFGMPDLSLTPRYQRLGEAAQANAKEVSAYFNSRLQEEITKLGQQFPHCSIDMFDVNEYFTQAYNDPQSWGFNPDFKKTPFIESSDYKLYDAAQYAKRSGENKEDNEVSPAEGYMFWDDVHPTANMHAKIAEYFYEKYSQKYDFALNLDSKETEIPATQLYEAFRAQYQKTADKEFNGYFGLFRTQNLPNKLKNINPRLPSEERCQQYLNVIFDHALNHKGGRSLKVLEKLGWVVDGTVVPIKGLMQAYCHATKTPLPVEQEKQVEESINFGAPQKTPGGSFEI